jgi:drug/metabolite transporter (DMT)-like permease
MFNSFSHILLSRVRNKSLDFETFLVAIGAFTPAFLIAMWLKLHKEDPNQWPTSNYYAFHLAIIMVAMVLTSIVWMASIRRLKEAQAGEEAEKDTE